MGEARKEQRSNYGNRIGEIYLGNLPKKILTDYLKENLFDVVFMTIEHYLNNSLGLYLSGGVPTW